MIRPRRLEKGFRSRECIAREVPFLGDPALAAGWATKPKVPPQAVQGCCSSALISGSWNGSASLQFGRPGEIHILVARVKADVAIHPEISMAARRIGIHFAWIGHVGLVGCEIFAA